MRIIGYMAMYDIKELGMIPPPYGGISVYLRRLIEKLNADGFSVGGYYVSSNDSDVVTSPLFDKWSWFETAKFPLKIFKYIHQLKKYRIIHSHLSLEAMLYLWTLKKLLNKKIIITVHNSMVEDYFKGSNRINTYFLRRLANKEDIVWIAVCQEAKKQMESLPFKFQSEIQVIPAYIPEPTCNMVLPQDLKQYLETNEKNLAFYGHSLMSNNGTDVYGYKEMLHIYKHVLEKHPNVGLVFCMADVSDVVGICSIEQYAKDLGVYNKIYWQRGSLPSLQILWEMIDVYVRPSSTDGDSLTVREAIEAGVRVVATDIVKRPSECILYNYGDFVGASNKILNVLNEGKYHTSKDFSHYERMKDIYTTLLNK